MPAISKRIGRFSKCNGKKLDNYIKLPKFILTFCNRLPLYRITKTLEKFKYRGKLRCRTRHFPEHRAFNAILATSRKTNLGSSGSEARLGWVLHTQPHVWAETSCYQTIERQGLSFLTEIGEKCKQFFFTLIYISV